MKNNKVEEDINKENQTNNNLNINSPIRLRLNKYAFTGGAGAFECYSHITSVEFID